ncbi:hypothetical protein [Croceibacterium ferulae]|uniref:hypothetical protein n=1 Tax=Croceibacterium ferulae TaxID=1854641 RepID=UPI000F863725|nr:hypothetical protein [Croceibacterium ferulae]
MAARCSSARRRRPVPLAGAATVAHGRIKDLQFGIILADYRAVRAAPGTDVVITPTALREGAKVGKTERITTNSLVVNIALAEMNSISNIVIDFVDDNLLDAEFDELQLEISVVGVSRYERLFLDEADVDYFIENAAIDLGDLSHYNTGAGYVTLKITLTTVIF